MEYVQYTTKKDIHVEGYTFRKNKKDWIKVRPFAFHSYREFCLKDMTIEQILDYVDEHYDDLNKEENEWIEEWERCND